MSEPVPAPVRVRFAPSPTGHTHLGSGRTALYDYLVARQTGGKFILRIEDTDRKRFVPGSEEELMASLRWLGLQWDEGPDIGGPYGPYRQSERAEIYREHARRLVERGNAYPCFCSAERLDAMRKEAQAHQLPTMYDGTCRRLDPAESARRVAAGEKHVIRFRMPREGSITVRDRVRGAITVENRQLDDYIIVKSDGLALYHLAAMVDDHLMEITHVIRGSEWLPTFPLHAHIIRALGWREPEFVHLSVFLKPSGKGKMSKRESADLVKDGYSIFVKDLKDLGYTPEGVVNWVALMGWSLDDHTEFFTLADLVKSFSLDRLNPSPAAINFTKLDHFNGVHIRALPEAELARRLRPYLEGAGLDRRRGAAPRGRPADPRAHGHARRRGRHRRVLLPRRCRRGSRRAGRKKTQRRRVGVGRRAVPRHPRGPPLRRARRRGAAASRPRRGAGPLAQPGLRHPARGGHRAERQPAAVREHGGHRARDGPGAGASGGGAAGGRDALAGRVK